MTKKNEFIISFCALIVSVSAVGLSLYGILSERRQKRIDAFIALEQYLHQPEISDARAAVRQSTAPPTITDPSVRRVLSSFDFAGSLVRHNAVDAEMFLDYWQVSLGVFAKRLDAVKSQKIAYDVNAEDYYRDFYWLISAAQIHSDNK